MLLQLTASWMASSHHDRGSLEQTMLIQAYVEQEPNANSRADLFHGADGCATSLRRLVWSQGVFQLVPALDEVALGREMRL